MWTDEAYTDAVSKPLDAYILRSVQPVVRFLQIPVMTAESACAAVIMAGCSLISWFKLSGILVQLHSFVGTSMHFANLRVS